MGYDAAEIGCIIKSKSMTLALAESCTGGGLGATFTSAPGASDFFLGSVVAYSNESKTALLGVRESTLRDYGAVSAETASEMAAGARKAFGSDIAVSITGIAGPGGGTAEKPVGLIYIAVCSGKGILVREYRFFGSRYEIRKKAAEQALDAIGSVLEE